MATNGELRLPEVFKQIWKTYTTVENSDEPTNSDRTQGLVRNACQSCKQAMEMVNELALFSKNEEIEEVSSNEIKYMLLPALMGYFLMQTTIRERMKVVKEGQDFYCDFLRMCRSYSVTTFVVPGPPEETEGTVSKPTTTQRPSAADMNVMAHQRNSKIQRYKEQKELEKKLNELQEKVEEDSVDDEVKRDYYLSLLKRWVNYCIEELDSIQTELQILEMMARKKEAEKKDKGKPQRETQPKPPPPMRPFILTKNMLQKQVYGLGYPGVPTVTIEEFCEQKLQEGSIQMPGAEGHSMQDWAADPDKDKEDREKEDTEKEEKAEREDPEALARARNWDDWKDDHRRGWGNRQNMG